MAYVVPLRHADEILSILGGLYGIWFAGGIWLLFGCSFVTKPSEYIYIYIHAGMLFCSVIMCNYTSSSMPGCLLEDRARGGPVPSTQCDSKTTHSIEHAACWYGPYVSAVR